MYERFNNGCGTVDIHDSLNGCGIVDIHDLLLLFKTEHMFDIAKIHCQVIHVLQTTVFIMCEAYTRLFMFYIFVDLNLTQWSLDMDQGVLTLQTSSSGQLDLTNINCSTFTISSARML